MSAIFPAKSRDQSDVSEMCMKQHAVALSIIKMYCQGHVVVF
jgi:hypothetical protein